MKIKDHMRDRINNMKIKQHVRDRLDKLPPLQILIRNFIILVLALFLIGLLLIYIQNSFESPKDAAEKIRSLGVFGPIAVILLIILEVVVAPIPGVLISVASGYAFGTYLGTVFSYIGNIIGTAIAFFLARKFGRPLVERLTRKEKLDMYDCFFKQSGNILIFTVYLFPIFPTDIISFVIGLSNISWKKFMVIISIAYIPNMLILNYIGATLFESSIAANSPILFILVLLAIAMGVGIYFYVKKKMSTKCDINNEQQP
ncbi:MAG: TVP38/TMEM64 family protein [archaeon]